MADINETSAGWPPLVITPDANKILPRPLDAAIRQLVERFQSNPSSGSMPVSRIVLDAEPGRRELTLTLWVQSPPDRAGQFQEALNSTLRDWSQELDDRTSDLASDRQFGFTVRSESPGPAPELEPEAGQTG